MPAEGELSIFQSQKSNHYIYIYIGDQTIPNFKTLRAISILKETPISVVPNRMATCSATAYGANSASLEITVISGEDLRQGRNSIGKGAFVAIRSGHAVVATAAGTSDTHGYPLWNECLHIAEPSHRNGWIQVDVSKRRHGDPASTPIHIAGVKVPLSDFSYGPVGYKHFLSYRLRDQEGRENGIVNLCVRRLGGNGRNGEAHFNGGNHHAIGYPVAPLVGYDHGYTAYKKY